MTWVLARLAEPSTWAGLGLIVTGVGNAVATKDWSSVLQALGGAIAVALPEAAAKKTS